MDEDKESFDDEGLKTKGLMGLFNDNPNIDFKICDVGPYQAVKESLIKSMNYSFSVQGQEHFWYIDSGWSGV